MKDSHVKSLSYLVFPGNAVDYSMTQEITFETEDFKGIVDSKRADFEMKKHYSTEAEAREIVDSYLSRWDVLIGLEYDPSDLSFKFHSSDIMDRAANNNSDDSMHSSVHIQTSIDAILHKFRTHITAPQQQFELSPNVETMYMRYRFYREGKETLLSMAYMCLTVLEASANGRSEAAKKYAISKTILDKLGHLTSEKGNEYEARKIPRGGEYISLTAQERDWILLVVKALIYRVGEYEYDQSSTLNQLTISNFPPI